MMVLSVQKDRRIWLRASVLVLAFGFGGMHHAGAAIWINEFMAWNEHTIADDRGTSSDWVELISTSISTENLGGLHLTDETASPTKWAIPLGVWLEPGEHLLIWCDGEPTTNPLEPLHASFRLSSTEGERIALYDRDGITLIDEVPFGQQAPDISYGRQFDGYFFWGPFATPSPGEPNTGYTPVTQPLAGILFVNEWMALNNSTIWDPSGQAEDWLELYNAGDFPIDLGGYFLTDRRTSPTKWTIPPANVIGPHGYAFFWADNDPEQGWIHTSFQLSGNGEDIALFEKDAATTIDAITFGPQYPDISEGRWPDGAEVRNFFSHPTPREPNYVYSARARSWQYYR